MKRRRRRRRRKEEEEADDGLHVIPGRPSSEGLPGLLLLIEAAVWSWVTGVGCFGATRRESQIFERK